MNRHPWRRWVDHLLNRSGRPQWALQARPRLETLEDRSLPSAGPLDPTFGNGGTVQTNLPAEADIHLVRSVQLSDGKIVAAGTVSGLYGVDFALERFNADGSLDTSFGAGGEVETPLLGSNNRLVGLALQSDGKILEVGSAEGDFIVVRYNADGSMDASFGTGGYVLTPFSGTADAHAVAVQSDGKIVVAGNVAYGAAGHSDFALARYNSDGSLDVSFGQGGEVLSPYESADASTPEVVWDVALQSDGKIVAAGQVDPSGSLVAGLVRYNTDGSIDVGFGSSGRVVTTLALGAVNYPGGDAPLGRPVSEALAANGQIVVTARDSGGVARYNSDGSIDTSFGNGGVLTVTDNTYGYTGAVQAVAIDAAGRILVGGRFASGTWFVARYNTDGTPDSTFGSEGQVITTFFPGAAESDAEVTDLVLDADGGVTAVGVGRTFFAPYYDLQSTATALARYDANGAPEAGFGTNGQELASYEGPSVDNAAGVVVQPDGKVVAAIHLTTTGGGTYGENDLVLVRYNADGPLDTTFGSGGVARLAVGADGSVAALALQADGKILVVGVISGSGDELLRFNSDGSPDTSFGSNGAVSLDFIANAVTVDANGDILVAGGKVENSTAGPPGVVARFLPNGSPDVTFGGTGEVTTSFNQAGYQAYAIVVQSDGKIVVTGNVRLNTSPYTEQLIGLVRYNTDGSLDTSFGSNGIVTTALGSGNGGVPFSGADAIALEPDGRIVVGGYAESGAVPYFLLVRYNTDGSLDTTFAQGGIAFSPDFGTAQGVAVQPDGTVVAVATAGDGLAVVSYEPDGRRDVAFTALGPNGTAAGVAVGPDGEVTVAGSFGTGAVNTVVARYLNQPPPPPVFVVGTDGSLSGENYTAPGWATLSPAGTILSISAVTDAAGISDVFAITTTGNSLWERTASGWVELSDGYFQQISATTDAAGNAVVFGVLGAGAGEYAGSLWEYQNGGWSELAGYGLVFLPIESPPSNVQYVSAVHTSQGAVAFAIDSTSNALFEYMTPGGWREVSTGSFQQVSAGLNSSGQAVVYGVLSDGSIWEQNPAFGTVGLNTGWEKLSGTGGAPDSFLSAAAGGPDKVFAVAADHTLWEHSTSGWVQLSIGSFANISARQTSSGVDEVFGTLTDGSLWEYSDGGGSGPMWQELLSSGVASSSAP